MNDQRPSVESNTNDDSDWTRRTFMSALGAAGLAGASTGVHANENTNQMSPQTTTDPADNEQLNQLLDRLETAAEILEFPARRIGAVPRGEQHAASRWGIHFQTEQSIHLGEAIVDAGRSGSFTAVVGEYNGTRQFSPVHERSINVDAGINRINLDMALDPGEYLLTRTGNFPLRRGEWHGWESQSRDGLELIGGSKPGTWEKPNQFWYYFFNLHVAANEEGHI